VGFTPARNYSTQDKIYAEMVHEKIFKLTVDREAKIVVKGSLISSGQVVIDYDFLVKEKNDHAFRAPIGADHPKYWKLKRLSNEKAILLQLVYSGLSKKQLNAALKEFKEKAGDDYVFEDTLVVEKKVRNLKGIKGLALENRTMATA
jgi:hypothetical protein